MVGAAAAIGRAVAAGAAVAVLYLTTGVPAPELLWPWQRRGHAAWVARRRAEAQQVAAALGVIPVRFLDWPTRTLRLHLREAGQAIADALRRTGAETLWTPAFEGAHQDHDVCAWLAARVAGGGERDAAVRSAWSVPSVPSAGWGGSPRVTVWEFAEYTLRGGKVHSQWFPAAPEQDAAVPPTVLTLTPAEQLGKRDLLQRYQSEQRNLGHIAVAQESFRLQPAHDWTRPPHPEPLFYSRFQWVPFRHPRIDFTCPSAVCAALVAADRDAGPPVR